jgi:glutamyl-tRNA reductase
MFSLAVINLSKSSSANESLALMESFSKKGLILKTCLRTMLFIEESDVEKSIRKDSNLKVHTGYDALNYAIKVMSGLESPVLGETEIFGQFKNQILPQLDEEKNSKFKEPVQFILSMVKQIRSKHFVGQGAQTYGGLVRKLLKSEGSNVLFIGAGSFSESIYPWLKPHKKIFFSVRKTEKYKAHEMFSEEMFFSLKDKLPITEPISVVICAPISSKDLEMHLKGVNVQTVVDLRESSKTDPVKLNSNFSYTLDEVFSQISENLNRKAEIKRSVEQEIEERLNKQLVKHRPFGWDDLCTSH